MFKKISRNGLSYDDIARTLYGTPAKAGDIAKLNNNTDGDVIVPVDEQMPAEGSDVRCNIDGVTYTRFRKSFLIDLIDGIKGAVLEFDYDSNVQNFKIGQNVSVYNSQGLFFNGFVKKPAPALGSDGNSAVLQLVSAAGVLLDTVVPEPLDFSYLSLRSIITSVCGYFGINVEFGPDACIDYVTTTEIGNSFSADEDEKAWDFLVRITGARGLFIKDTGTGLFVGTIQDKEPVMSFIEGEAVGVYEWTSLINTDDLCRYYVRHTQYPEAASATAEIPFDLPLTNRKIKDDAFVGTLQEYTNWAACRAIGEAFKISLKINDLSLKLKSGDFVNVLSPSCEINEETKMIIEDLYEDNTQGLVLVLTMPCAYTGVIPESLPLC